MPIASCHFVIARPLGNLHTAREQVATHHQPRNRDIFLPLLTLARLVVGTAGSRFPNRDIVLASLTPASLVVGTAGVDSEPVASHRREQVVEPREEAEADSQPAASVVTVR